MLVLGEQVLSDDSVLLRHAGLIKDCTLAVRMRPNYSGPYSSGSENSNEHGAGTWRRSMAQTQQLEDDDDDEADDEAEEEEEEEEEE
eukprot:8247172-Pyramimonas_sp.AAC.1